MNTTQTLRLSLATLSCLISSLLAVPTTITVNVYTDTPADQATGGLFGANTNLRGALNQTNINPLPAGYKIVFQDPGQTITLGAMLPILGLVHANPLTIDGGSNLPTIINGGNTYRGFFANQGEIILKNLHIQNVVAIGGNGGDPGGGGGMGAGAGLFINEAKVSLSKTTIDIAQTTGGQGGAQGSSNDVGGGGGGMGGNGGSGSPSGASGGGGGIGGNGGNAATSISGGGGGIDCGNSHFGAGGSGTIGGDGGGIGEPGTGQAGASSSGVVTPGGLTGGGGGSPTISGAGGGGGYNGQTGLVSNVGGMGGFGGGGGGSSSSQSSGASGGFGGGSGGGGADNNAGILSGFGGGGGSRGNPSGGQGVDGGFGGGAGGSYGTSGAQGGVGGGDSENQLMGSGEGGGGAGFGGAIFVNATGSLTILDSFDTVAGNNSTIAGTGFKPGWAAGDDCFFLTGSSITFDPNGSSIIISNSIADDSSASFVGVQPGTKAGTADGASITIGNPLNSPGTVSFPFSNNSTYSGPTLVQRGTFALDGSITSPVTVFNGGKMQGIGAVLNNVNIQSGGRIHAGNSIGTLTIENLSLTSGSIMELDIDLSPGSSSSSIYTVNGSLTLNNATLSLAFASQSSPPQSHTYEFIHYIGAAPGGQFSPVVANAPLGLHPILHYFPNIVTLELVPFANIIGVGVPLSKNQETTLAYLLSLSNASSLQSILNDLAFLTPDELREALNSISPARNAAAPFFANQTTFATSRIPLVRLRDNRILHSMAPKQKNNSLAAAFATKSKSLLAMAGDAPALSIPADPEQDIASKEAKPAGKARTAAAKPENYGFWVAGFGEFLSQDAQNSNPQINDAAAGAVVGFDYYGYQNGLFNLSAGYTHNDISERSHAGSGTSNGAVLSVYGTGYLGDGYLEGGVLGGYNKFHMSRHVVIGGDTPFDATAKSSFNDWVLMPHLGGGYDWVMDWGVVEPFASLDWAVSFQQAYKETGASPLNTKIKSQTPSILRSEAGLNVYETWDNATSAFIFQQSASYINKTFFSTNVKSAIIVPTISNPGSFTVTTYNKTLNLAGVSAELFYKHKKSGFFVSGAYSGEFGSGYMSNDITGTLGVFF